MIILIEGVVVEIDCVPIINHRGTNASENGIGKGEVKILRASYQRC